MCGSNPATSLYAQLCMVASTAVSPHRATAGQDEVSYVSTVLGPFDVFFQVLVADDAALWTFLQEVVRPMAGVLETKCTLEIKVHKLWFDTTPDT